MKHELNLYVIKNEVIFIFKDFIKDLNEISDLDKLSNKIKEINKYYSIYIFHHILEKDLKSISEDMYKFEKFVRDITNKYYNNSFIKLHDAITEALSISKISRMEYEIVSEAIRINKKYDYLLKDKNVEKILRLIYKNPHLKLSQLEIKEEILEKLINTEAINNDTDDIYITSQFLDYINNRGLSW